MSYLVLARKYRPRNFTEMVGQEHVVQALTNALTTRRLHHAYLFTGTRGVGKTTVSRILAKSLNCQGPDGQGGITATPCGVCQACTDIDSGRFIDYTELDAASNRGVDEVQALLEQAVYKPVQGRFKVFMIDEVHMLTNTAFNAMLKTLEEPPEYLKFVLATTDPQKVPVTVLSRCLQFNLRPMAPETVLEHLTTVLDAEQVPAEVQALRLIARAARGSMRDALSLTDQAIAFGSGQLQEATVRQMLGSVDRSYVIQLIDALTRGELLDGVMKNYRRFYMRKALFHYPWRGTGFRRRYLLGCLKAFLKAGVQRTFYDLGKVGYWGPQTKETVHFDFDETRTIAPAQMADWEAAADRARKHKERQAALRAQGKDRALERNEAKAMACGGSTAQLDEFCVPEGERVQ